MRTFFNTLLLTLSLTLILPQAATAGGKSAKIRKVILTHLDLTRQLDSSDLMVNFERQRLLHGAITNEEYLEREGKYFTIFWWGHSDREPGMVVRFEYLQANTGPKVKVKEVTVDKIRRQNTTDINIIGDEYDTDGNVIAWRASLVRNGEVVSTVESFLWE